MMQSATCNSFTPWLFLSQCYSCSSLTRRRRTFDASSISMNILTECMSCIVLQKNQTNVSRISHKTVESRGKIFIFVRLLAPCSVSTLPLFKRPWAPVPLKASSRMFPHQAAWLEATEEFTLKCIGTGQILALNGKTELNKEKRKRLNKGEKEQKVKCSGFR